MNWNLGYVTEIDYVHGYTRELCPKLLRLACLSAGVAPPANKALTYLELGYGQGLSVNIHAAASDGAFWGTDFNPSQAAHARAMAEASGARATLLDESFAELAARPELPEFDIIGLHGIWSWVSDQNAQIVVDLVRRRLRVGGLLYISYNCLPGWAAALPLRHLMKLHADIAGEGSGLLGKLDAAVGFAQQVIDSGANYFRANPAVPERLKKIAELPKVYVAHEYLNEEWRVMPFSAVADALDQAKVSFVCSAHLIDQVDAINLTAEGQKLLAGIKHPVLKQSVRDYFVNQQFRRDVFIKGPRQLSQLEQVELLRSESFVLLTNAGEVPDKVKGALGEASVPKNIHDPVVEALAEGNYAPKTVQQLTSHPKLKSLPFAQIVQALLVLTGAGYAHPAQAPDAAIRDQCRKLNSYLFGRARSSPDITFLASAVTGGAVPVSRFDQLFLMGRQQHGLQTDADLAGFVWAILAAQGQLIVKEGKTLQKPEQNLAELTRLAQEFQAKRLEMLTAIEVA